MLLMFLLMEKYMITNENVMVIDDGAEKKHIDAAHTNT